MAFCRYSVDLVANSTTSLDNIFITNYLPFAPDNAVKVYVYGLFKCQAPSAPDNTLERFARELQMSEKEVEEIFSFWQEQGLVQLIQVIPFEVRYLPIRDVLHSTRKFNEKKYANFNTQIQEILCGRMITPNEYHEYYDVIERLHMEKEALILVIDYCVRQKGNNVGYPYILTVAKNWASQNLLTESAVKGKIEELNTISGETAELAKNLGIKRALTIDEFELYKKWVVIQGFDKEVICHVAKKCKKRGSNYAFEAMDRILERYFAQKLTTVEEIEAFEGGRRDLADLARKLTRALGLFYENIDPVVDQYVFTWKNLGFSDKMLEEIADYCFKSNIRTLEGMNKVLVKFQKLGILSEDALSEYFSGVIAVDKKIKEILEKIGLSRGVNQFDRDKFKIWTEVWHTSKELLDYACSLALGKDQPMQYLSAILSSLHDKNITTVEDAKKSLSIENPKKKKANFSSGHTYTKDEMNALFQSIEEVEV